MSVVHTEIDPMKGDYWSIIGTQTLERRDAAGPLFQQISVWMLLSRDDVGTGVFFFFFGGLSYLERREKTETILSVDLPLTHNYQIWHGTMWQGACFWGQPFPVQRGCNPPMSSVWFAGLVKKCLCKKIGFWVFS